MLDRTDSHFQPPLQHLIIHTFFACPSGTGKLTIDPDSPLASLHTFLHTIQSHVFNRHNSEPIIPLHTQIASHLTQDHIPINNQSINYF